MLLPGAAHQCPGRCNLRHVQQHSRHKVVQSSLCLPAVRGKSAPRQMRLTTPPASPMAMAASHHHKGDGGTPFGQSLIVRALTRDYLRGHTTPQLNASSLPYPRTAAQVRHCQLSGAHTPPQLNASCCPVYAQHPRWGTFSCQGTHHPSAECVCAALPMHSSPGEARQLSGAPCAAFFQGTSNQKETCWAQQAPAALGVLPEPCEEVQASWRQSSKSCMGQSPWAAPLV